MPGVMGEQTVRDAAFEVMRRRGMTTIFANPGSTEIAFLVDLPDDLRFVLALHEASVVGLATGWAIGRDAPAFVNLHTTAGLGNAVGALATARVNRAPLVVLVGQQDRRQTETRIHAPAIDVDRAGAALTMIASLFRSGQMQMLAQTIEKRRARIDPQIVLFTIHPKRDGNGIFGVGWRFLVFHARLPECCSNRTGRGQQTDSA